MIKNLLSIILIGAWCCSPAFAQSVLSVESPLGIPYGHVTGPSQAMGGSGVGVADNFFSMADNPGNLGAIGMAVFSSLVSLDLLSLSEDNNRSKQYAFSPRLLSLAFPLGKLGTFGFSLDRRNNANYRFRTTTTATSVMGETDTSDFGIVKHGGVAAWQAGWGYSLGRYLRFGLCYERVYLSINEIDMMRTSFNTIEGTFESSLYDTSDIVFRGNGIRAGMLVPLKKITIGVSGEYFFTGDATRMLVKGSPLGSSSSSDKFTLHLPQSLTAGVSYAASPEWLIAASSGLTLWQNYYSDVALGNKPDNALSFAGGAQFIPAPNLLVPHYWEIMRYRAGVRYSQLPVTTGSEVAVSLGLGLPLLQGGGLVDLIAEFGARFDSRFGNYSEKFLQVFIGINGGHSWSQNTGVRY